MCKTASSITLMALFSACAHVRRVEFVSPLCTVTSSVLIMLYTAPCVVTRFPVIFAVVFSVLSRRLLSRPVSSRSSLVSSCTLLLLCKQLTRLCRVFDTFLLWLHQSSLPGVWQHPIWAKQGKNKKERNALTHIHTLPSLSLSLSYCSRCI